MNFRGYKRGGLYKILRASNSGVPGVIGTFADPNAFSFSIIPNNAIIMFLERLDNGNAMVLYEDKKLEIAFGTLLEPMDI